MQTNEIRIAVLSALLGGMLVAGFGAQIFNKVSANAAALATVPIYVQPLAAERSAQIQKPSALQPLRRSSTQAQVEARKRRSTNKSIAIVAGSAGAGAAIGAISGGGKGAAIGAASGGTAGFIYDRITAKGN